MSEIKNVFISHFHQDDKAVTNLTDLVSKKDYNIRNSSIRANPDNQEKLDQKRVSDETIRRLLRRKISWAGIVLVLIGPETHERKWVNWEIETANKRGKRIIGVFIRGAKDSDIPENLKKFGDGLIRWNTEKIISALEGEDVGWCNSEGQTRIPDYSVKRVNC